MMISWFKHYHGAATDAKFLAAADIAGADPLAAFATYSFALEYASDLEDRGSLAGFNPQVIASFYRRSVDEIERILQAFRDLGMIAGDRIANWDKRQGCSAAASSNKKRAQAAERQRRCRRKKALSAFDVTRDERDKSVTSRTEKEEEGESENNRVSESITAREGARVHEGLSESDPDVPAGAARPLAPAFPSENVVKLSDSTAAKNAEKEARLKARLKALRRQKVMRFASMTFEGDELERRMNGLQGYDEAHDMQWWLDHCDAERIAANWDDKRRTA